MIWAQGNLPAGGGFPLPILWFMHVMQSSRVVNDSRHVHARKRSWTCPTHPTNLRNLLLVLVLGLVLVVLVLVVFVVMALVLLLVLVPRKFLEIPMNF